MEIKRIKAALIGLNFGQWVIENELMKEPGCSYFELIGVCDLDAGKAKAVGEKYGVRVYGSLDDVLADPEVEAVVLITGPVGRGKQIERILESGRPVMTTKPFDTSSAETVRVLNRAKELKLPVFMNSPTPLPSENIRQMQEWIHAYGLGRPIGYRATVWCSYREKPDGSWYDDPQLCPAAPIFRLGIYLINDLCRLMGPVEDVNVLQSHLFTSRPTADNAQLGILHRDGTIGSIYASFCIDDKQYYRNSLELNFERGTIYRNIGPKDNCEDGTIRLQLAAGTEQGPVCKTMYIHDIGGYQWKEFYRAIHGEDIGETISPDQVATAIRIIELMREKCGAIRNT